MLDTLYDFFRSSCGFAFMIIGLGFVVEPGRHRSRMAFGSMFFAIGGLFVFSWFSIYYTLPIWLDSLLLIALVLIGSQSLFEVALFLFGDEAHRGARRKVYLAGTAWAVALWLLPAFDSVFDLPALRVSIEDGRRMGPFGAASFFGVYAWPIAVSVISLRVGRWHLSDLPKGPGAVRGVLVGLALVVVVLLAVVVAMVAEARWLYRLGHTLLQLTMLVWYFFIRSNPDLLSKARKEIGAQHKKRLELGPEEAAGIRAALERLMVKDRVFMNPDLSLQNLAKTAGIPAYRLSAYFNAHRGASFSDWLNDARIDYSKGRLVEELDATILDVAFEAGYSSKAVFNTQFRRRVGMTPSEYRAKRG